MNDLKFAFRQLLKNPGFTAVAVLTLALGIGANTAIFSAVDAVIIRPLPYAKADHLVMIWGDNTKLTGTRKFFSTPPEWHEWRQHNTVFTDIAASQPGDASLSNDGEPQQLPARKVSANFWSVLGAQPLLRPGADAGQLPDVERRQECGFPPGGYYEQAAWLPQVARHLGHDLARRDPQRAREARGPAYGRLHGLGHTSSLEEVRGDVRHVEVALVDARPLDRRHDVSHRVPDGTRVVAVERVPGRDEYGMRAATPGLGTTHRRVDAEAPCLVVRRGHDAAALRVAAHDERLPTQ
jgi:hypothetical protein